MKIIHTSDWHLGKNLEGYSRQEEQQEFIEEFIDIVNANKADLVLISGDIYDTSNPPAAAEALFYDSVKRIYDNGKRAVLVIAGNHDNPDRLEAVRPLAHDKGIIILGTPKSKVEKGACGEFTIVDAEEGYLEIDIRGERCVVVTLPYPSEKRLNEIIGQDISEEIMQKSYSERIGKFFKDREEKFREDTINIAVSHLYVAGGHTSDSERSIHLGGSYAVDMDRFTDKAQYIALGHLHKNQKYTYKNVPIVYSGSPIQYSKSERNNSNCVFMVEVKAGEEAVVSKIPLRNYKPIEVWECNSIEEALERCREDGQSNKWVYIHIKTSRVLMQEEIKEMRKLRPDIIEIIPMMEGLEQEELSFEDMESKSMKEVFTEFYKKERNTAPDQELLEFFLEISGEALEVEKA